MNKYIIIIAPISDFHAKVIADEISSKTEIIPLIIDTKDFPRYWQLSFDESGNYILVCNKVKITGEQIISVWNRRCNRPLIGLNLEKRIRNFCAAESLALLNGWLLSLGNKVVNPITGDRKAVNKPYQLFCANKFGLKIPKTIITNEPSSVLDLFNKCNGSIIYKILTNTDWQLTETRILIREQLDNLESLCSAPIIFQEFIEGRDIRITIIGKQVIGTEIITKSSKNPVDWRIDINSEYIPCEIPQNICKKIIRLNNHLGIVFGAYDFKLRNTDWFFLEVNNGGQFLFVDIHSKQNTITPFLNLLINPMKAYENVVEYIN